MKKTIMILIWVLLCTASFGQKKITELGTATSVTAGSITYIRQGATGDIVRQITIANLLAGYATVTAARNIVADSLNAFRANAEAGSIIYALHAPDTAQHTANYTVAASDWRKDQHCLKATSIVITVPQNLSDWPVGGVINFYGEGAGIMVFKKAAGVVFISDTDSIATSRKGQAVSIKKIATNKYFLLGPLTD